MKLLLTSAGLSTQSIKDKFISLLDKPVSDILILVIAFAQNDEEQFYVDQSVNELKSLGINKIVYFNLKEESFDESQKFDAIYVCGGNTFAILNRMKETGVFEYIKKLQNTDTVYVGVSAGSIIAGPDIAIAGWGSEADTNEIGLQDFNSLNFTDISIYPHFHDELKSEVEEFRKQVEHPVIELTNEQAVVILGEESEII
ncbi:MAG: Type 1 glutamine amidotransferase-like domain-containing protein [bacterium]